MDPLPPAPPPPALHPPPPFPCESGLCLHITEDSSTSNESSGESACWLLTCKSSCSSLICRRLYLYLSITALICSSSCCFSSISSPAAASTLSLSLVAHPNFPPHCKPAYTAVIITDPVIEQQSISSVVSADFKLGRKDKRKYHMSQGHLTHTHTHIYTHARMHACMHAHTHFHMHTHTCTHTPLTCT